MRHERRSRRRRAGIKLLEVIVGVAFLVLMLVVILPWAASSLSNDIVERIERTPTTEP